MTRKLSALCERHSRRPWTTAATLVAVAIVGVIFVSGSSANLAPSTFEGDDGNMVVNTAGHIDWATAGLPVQTLTDVASGGNDNAFGQGTKEADTNVTVVTGSIPPQKNDLVRSYLSTETVSGQSFLYLAWIRANNTGDAHIDFELNQNATAGFTGSTVGPVTLNRTVGDLLISYDFGGSGTPVISLSKWTGSDWSAPENLSAEGFAEAMVNTASITDAISGGTLGIGDFGEASINLSLVPGVFAPNTCESFGSTSVKSRSAGSSDSSELKDFIAPVPIHVSNCGSIELKKHWVGTAGTATLKIGTTDGASNTASQTVNGVDGTTGQKTVLDGSYFVSEDVTNASIYTSSLNCIDNGGAGFDPGSNGVPVSAGHTVVCTYTNTRKQGTIKLGKHWVGTPGNASLAIGSAGSGSANVATGTANGVDGDTGTHAVDTGTYYVSEQFDSNLYTTSLGCFNDANNNGVNDQGDSPVTAGANGDVAVGDGQHVICVYTNTRKQGTLEVKKVLNPTNDTGTFDLTIDSTTYTNSNAGFGNNGTTGQIEVDTGSHTAAEAGHGATSLSSYVSSYTCSNGASGNGTSISGITVNAGDHVLCTFTNARKPQLTLVKNVTNNNGGTAAATAWLLSANGAGNDPNSFSGQGGAGPHDVTAGVAYSLTESGGPSGYTGGDWNCVGGSQSGASITLSAGQSATCTIVNDDNPPALHLIKTITNDNGGTAAATDWTLHADGASNQPTSLSGSTPVNSTASFKADTYALSENGPPNYTASLWTCVLTGTQTPVTVTSAHVTIGLGQDVTCTINNNDNAPALHLIKNVTNDNGGTAAATDWTLTATGAANQPTNLSGSTPVNSSASFKADTYTLGESGPANYTGSAWTCVLTGTQTPVTVTSSHVTVGIGQDVTCTIVNNDNPPALHLIKSVTNDNGGTAPASAWTLHADGAANQPTNLSGTTPVNSDASFKADTYALSESGGPSGYTASNWTCVLTGTQTPVTVTSSHVTVGIGQNVTCTIVNNDDAPALHLIKNVTNDNGGTALATAWTLHAAGASGSPTNLNGSTPVDSGPTFKADTYTLSETGGPSGYTPSNWSCVVTGTQTPVTVTSSTVTVGLGQNVTCTIVNDDNVPALHLHKSVTNDNGGTAVPTDWTLTATGTGGSPTNLSGTTPVSSDASFKADTYALAESGPAHYTGSTWSCVLTGSQTPVTVTNAHVTVGLGQNVTCTIVNNDDAPALHLLKTVTNDNGGTALATAWTLNAAGPTPLSGSTPVNSGASFDAGTYTLTETNGPSGYTPGDWVCTGGGNQNGNTITVGLGENVTCTINNNDNGPALHLRKTVTNDNGGTAAATDWTLHAAGTGGSPSNLNGTTPVNSDASFKADTYALSESGGPANYTASNWSCVVTGTQTPVTVTNAHVTVGLGDDVTCTIVNDDNVPALHLHKSVTNDNGGTAVATDWTLHADGAGSSPTNLSGTTPVNSDATFKADTYALSETGPVNYTASSWTCVVTGSQTPVTVTDAHVTVGLGQDVTCSIVNNDNAPALHLRKTVTNDNGGTALATAWTLNAAGPTPLSGSTPVDSGASFDAGTYSLSESGGPSNYTAGAWVCTGGGNQNGSSITVGLGEDVTCTINNNDNAPSLHLRKTVTNDNGGTAAATDWTLHATGTGNAPSNLDGSTPVDSGPSFNADTYALSETDGPSGYTAGTWSCVAGETPVTVTNAHVTIGLGQNVTCTINNNDNVPSLHLRKTVTNDNGGTAVPADWTLTATGTGEGATNLTGQSPVNSDTGFKAGTYALAESGGPSDYTAGNWACVITGTDTTVPVTEASVTVGLGQSVTCTINNNDNGPALHLLKTVTNDDGGTALPTAWTLTATKSGASSPTLSGSSPVDSGASFTAGTYALAESNGPSDYTASNWTCTLTDSQTTVPVTEGSVHVGLGQNVTCTIVNDDNAPTITIEKRVLPSTDTGTFKFTLTQGEGHSVLDNGTDGYGNGDSTGQVDVKAGSLGIDESGNGSTVGSLYSSSWSCSSNRDRSASGQGTSISLTGLGLGEDVTCTYTNTKLATLVVKKVVDNSNGGGSKTPADFTLHVTTGGLDVSGSPAAGTSTGTTYTLLPGTYKVGEGSVSGYNLTKIDGCLADGSITLEAGQTATCTLTNTSNAPPPPPPPPPPAPRIDLQITKSATPSPATVGNQVTWTMVVTNNGPNTAHGVTVADPVPAGMTFVSATSSQGTCTGGALVNCTIGTMNVGSSVTITLVTTAAATGTITNTATTVGTEQETNTANNTASANVVVNGVFTPPVVYCTAVAVSPKQLFVGRKNTLTMKLTSHGKAKAGVKVKIKGSTLNVTTKPSNARGSVKQTVKPMKAGIVVFQPVATKSCKNPRIGVIGVFTPPVTG